jgi:hypothetical protein
MIPEPCLMAAVVLRVAPKIIDAIVDQLRDDPTSLRHCSVVAKGWRKRSLKWLFEAIVIQITADPWSFVQWLGEPTPGIVWGGRIQHLVDIEYPGLRLATKYARELRLVQRPPFMWIVPSLLHPILHRFAMFKNVTSLSLNSLSIHHFNEVDTTKIFGHFFPTVRKLSLEDPRSSARGLLWFILRFRVLDDLSICDPEWDDEESALLVSCSAEMPPFRGELEFLRLHDGSADFVNLLARVPIAFRRISIINCQVPSAQINRLLNRLSPSLASFSMSAWFDSG